MSETLAQQVEALETQCDDLIELCSNILATVTLDGNKEHFDKLPPDWHDAVKGWKKSFAEIKATRPTGGAGESEQG